MIIDRIRNFFEREVAQGSEIDEGFEVDERDPDALRIAACALLLEVAHADDYFSASERGHLRELVRRHFRLKRSEADELISVAEDERHASVDLWRFTRLINASYSTAQKMVLVEAMWGIVLADGELAGREEQLMRRISHLIGLKAGYLADALRRHEATQPEAEVEVERAGEGP